MFADRADQPLLRAFVCTNPNPWNYPAGDRSGRLEQVEEPNLGKLIAKLASPGQRKPFTTAVSLFSSFSVGKK